MNKTEQLLKMLEHPEQYSEQQWLDILADDECRELYSLMAKTRSAFTAEQADERLTDEMINEQWQRLEAEYPTHATIVPLLRKAAAAAVVAVPSAHATRMVLIKSFAMIDCMIVRKISSLAIRCKDNGNI